MTKQAEQPGFEMSLKRLEKIVAEMDGGDLSLDAMIRHFEEGQKLVKLCTKKLEEVERKIEILVKKGDKVEAEGFEDDASAADEPDGEGAEQELF